MLGFGKKNAVEISVSNRTIARIILFLLGTVLAIRVLENMIHPLTLIFVSFFLSLALNPAVTWISKRLKSKSRVRATAISYGVVTTILVMFTILVVPPLISQTTEFSEFYPYVLGYMIAYMPTLALVNSVSFNQMKDPAKEFPLIRVFGTAGWIIAGWIISFGFQWDSIENKL